MTTLAWVGLAAQAVLAALFFVVWRALRHAWAGLLCAGFAVQSAAYAVMACGVAQVELDRPPSVALGLLAVTALVLISLAVIDYVALEPAQARRLRAGALALAVAAVALGLAGRVSRGAGLLVMATYVGCWAVLFVRAMRREPRSGHGLVVVALLSYPATVAAGLAGWIAPQRLGGVAVLPYSVLGATLLTTGLLRAHRRAAEALAQREQARAQLQRANESLEQQVAARTRDLRETIEGLEGFNRSISHDLRGPLGGIAGLAHVTRQAVGAGDLGKAADLLGAVERQAHDSIRLVESLLALARASDCALHRRPVDSRELADEALNRIGPATLAATVEIGDLPAVSADPDLLRQVFANLIGNALKFCAGAPAACVQVGARQGLLGTEFFVRDNGVGFDADAAARLFKPFQRLHGAAFEGFGVGLSVVKRIVERHGGRVWAEGEPGRGATFWFDLGREA